jgi:endo-1,4-beta-xylanase
MNRGSGKGLRDLTQRHGLQIGTCVSVHPLRTEPRYAETIVREFNVVTPENALKFVTVRPSRNRYNFADADAVVAFAEANGIMVRGHVLVWYTQLPQWLTACDFDRASLTEIMTDHIATVVGRYAGKIPVWDVVNEAIADDGSYRDSVWHRTIGRGYIDIAFRAAREADPNALLFYNDYGIERSSQHAEATYGLLRDLVRRQVPVDGVGLQMHLDIGHLDHTRELAPRLARLADLGLRLHVTELDVRMKLDGRPTAEQLTIQANVYRRVLRACLDTPRCEALVLWGFIDRHSWIPHFYEGEGAALIFDEEYRKKPSYHAMVAELRGWSADRR